MRLEKSVFFFKRYLDLLEKIKEMEVEQMVEIRYNEKTEEWEEAKEPYITLEIETEEDWKHLKDCVAYWNEHHDKEGNEI